MPARGACAWCSPTRWRWPRHCGCLCRMVQAVRNSDRCMDCASKVGDPYARWPSWASAVGAILYHEMHGIWIRAHPHIAAGVSAGGRSQTLCAPRERADSWGRTRLPGWLWLPCDITLISWGRPRTCRLETLLLARVERLGCLGLAADVWDRSECFRLLCLGIRFRSDNIPLRH